jgi:putative CocE/NonD family hydrolase
MRVLGLLAAAAMTVSAAAQADVSATHRKLEYMIPMRDGVRLYTAVFVPKSAAKPGPILMQRTPYSSGPYGPDAYRRSFGGSPKMVEDGFIFAYQDVRGKYMSEGVFENLRPQLREYLSPHDIDESTDTYDTVEFLIKNVPGNNQKVGLWGISYPGGYAALGAVNSHPALKAASPQAPTSDWFIGDDFHHNGAFFLQDAVSFYGGGFGAPRPVPSPSGGQGVGINIGGDAYRWFLNEGPISRITAKWMQNRERFWADMMREGTYTPFWQNRSVPKSMVGVKAAVLTVGGWFDAEDCWGPPKVYGATERQNPGIVNQLVMGPWFHGMWAGRGSGQVFHDQDFGSNTSAYYQDEIEYPFFRQHLMGDGPGWTPEAHVFETGANRWRTFPAWPPKDAKQEKWTLGDKGFLAPPDAMLPTVISEVGYTHNPAAPVPYQGGTLTGRTRSYMLDDQRFAASRQDVVTFESDILTEDVTIAGPITASLLANINGTDCDFIVKVIDVLPNGFKGAGGKDLSGYQMLVRGEVMRGKFRNSFSNPQPFTPGEWTPVNFELPDAFHTFKKGHRIMVQVQSSWFPLVDLNPGIFTDIYSAGPEAFRPVTVRLRTGQGGSAVSFGRLKL